MQRVLVWGALLVAAPMAMGQGMSLNADPSEPYATGPTTIEVNIVTNALPLDIQADLNSTGMIDPVEMAITGYSCDLEESGAVPTFDVTNAHNTAVGWATTGPDVRNVADDLLDPSTQDGSDVGGAQIASVAVAVWNVGKLADIAITILPGAAIGTYTITPTNASYVGMITASPYPAAPIGALTVKLVPEPTTALLFLAGLPFLRRRRVA